MRLWHSVTIVLLVAGQAILAQEDTPVVLVWGEYLAAANEREAPGTRSYLENIAKALDAVGLAYERTKDSEVESGALEGHKLAIFPYNANLTEAERSAIRKFVAAGGKLYASFTSDPVFGELLGVETGGSVRPEYEGYFTSIAFNPDAPVGVPEAVSVGSWYSHAVTTLPGTRVIAEWADGDGKRIGMPALTMNENGYYHAHVMIGADSERKGRMFLALTGHFFPEVWRQSLEQAIASIADVHGYDSWDAVADAVGDAKGHGGDTARERLAAATAARQAANELLEQGKFPEALEQAHAARQGLRSATYPLAENREGELRAVWTSGTRIEDWEAVMRDLAEAGLNAIFPMLCDAGGAYYESDVLPRADGYTQDQLAACIEAARKHHIEVHPWRVNWRISRGTEERKAELRAADRLTLSKDGETGEWLCPSDERNFRLEVAAMLEMAEKYPVHGIHFDYIRYHNSNYCYCEKCHANFERDADLTVDDWPKDCLAGGPHYDVFQDWRREQITRVVREVYQRAHELRPDVVVSAAVFSNWPGSRTSIGQDAAAWAEEGIIDLLMPMTYTDSNERLGALTKEHVALTAGRAIVAEGIGAFSSHSQFTGPDQLIQQIETARSLGADGFCIFNYGSSLVEGGFLPALAEGCTGPQTFTPTLRPKARFLVDDTEDGEWILAAGREHAVGAQVEAVGPWASPVTSLEGTWVLQLLDGGDRGVLGKRTVVRPERAWSARLTLDLEPGGYRLAFSGTVELEDGSEHPFICRSRPIHVLTQDEFNVRQGKLPPPSKTTGKPRVGVLVEGYGGRGMLAALRKLEQIEVVEVERLSADAARECQVLVVTQGRSAVSVDERLAGALRNWIAAGGRLLATHDAVGYRGHAPIAPEVCKGGVGHERKTDVRMTDAPVVPEAYRSLPVSHAFFDHVVLDPGKRGQTVVADDAGKPIIVVGELGEGRFVASGIAFGLNADTDEAEPKGDEAELLRELIEWLASDE